MGGGAFYNETQVFNRDISVLAIHTFLKHYLPKQARFKRGAAVLDALAASGLRALRYAAELLPEYGGAVV